MNRREKEQVDKEIEKSLITYSFIYKFISYPGQKEAAIITPPENPSRLSIIFLLTFLKKKTTDAPNIVTNQVKSVAKRA